MGKKGKRHGRGAGGGSKRSAARQSSDGWECVGSGGSRRTAGGAALDPPPAPTAKENRMSGILAQTLPDLPVRTFRFPPNASRQQVMETVFYEYMSEINANSVRTHGNDSHGVLSVLTSALCLPPRYGDEIRLSALLWWNYHLDVHHPPRQKIEPWNTCESEQELLELLASFSLEHLMEENTASFLRVLSKEKCVSSLVRAHVLILRANLLMYTHFYANNGPTPTSQEASLRRRAVTLLADVDISKIPISLQIRGCTSPYRLRENCIEFIEISKRRLDDMQAHAKPSFTDESSAVRYLLTVGGGACDGCGKSLEELSMSCLFQCGRCRLAHYCSVSCQARAWECGHYRHCKKFGVFGSGERAVLHGLRNSSDLNGMTVLVEGSLGDSDKYKVDLIGMKRLLCVKKKNLRHLRPASIGKHVT